MIRTSCPLESDVLAAVSTRRWPERAEPDLVAHVATCHVCADLVAVASAFEAEHAAAPVPPALPDPALVYWRARLRARVEAERAAARPITVAQAVGLAVFVGVLGAVFGATATWFQSGVAWAWGVTQSLAAFQPPSLPQALVSLLASHGLLLAAAAIVCVVLAPVAVYLTVRED